MTVVEIHAAADACLKALREINAKYGKDGFSSAPHMEADLALVDFFRAIGRDDIADEYENVSPKWYE